MQEGEGLVTERHEALRELRVRDLGPARLGEEATTIVRSSRRGCKAERYEERERDSHQGSIVERIESQ
jgi:hypothetical protein